MSWLRAGCMNLHLPVSGWDSDRRHLLERQLLRPIDVPTSTNTIESQRFHTRVVVKREDLPAALARHDRSLAD